MTYVSNLLSSVKLKLTIMRSKAMLRMITGMEILMQNVEVVYITYSSITMMMKIEE